MRCGRNLLIGAALGALLVEANKPRPLADLPNREGFLFTGHKLGGEKVQCVVRKVKAHDGELGGRTYDAYRAFTVEGDAPIYRELCAWSPQEL